MANKAKQVYISECMTCDRRNFSWKHDAHRCTFCGQSTLEQQGMMVGPGNHFDEAAALADDAEERGY